jgi:phosphoribosyl-ATP pyrophosphohydrolase/phosphoribosyl-ATP pyrophosphohydrolase/phosphoribosyl-AMP cyclohydrolase
MENIQYKKLRNIWTQKEFLLEFNMLNTLENLIKLARDRKSSPVEGSYTNKLLTDKSLSKAKVLEEVNELIEAVEENSNKIHEAADVFYHLLMYLEANDVKIEEVMQELENRKK